MGLVKRTEESEGKYLTGVEFIERDKLTDKLSQAELDMLSDELNGFDDNVRKVLTNYLEK